MKRCKPAKDLVPRSPRRYRWQVFKAGNYVAVMGKIIVVVNDNLCIIVMPLDTSPPVWYQPKLPGM